MSTTTTSNTVKEKESTTSTTSSTDDNTKTQNVLKKSDEVLEKPLEGEELKAMLMKQIEYYFSKENLANDRYLVSQMNAETFVPIQVIANFKMIKSHSSDIELITKVMKECPSVVVDETNTLVKPKVKSHRNIIILRDIPSSTPIEEVKAIFNTEGCGKISDIKSDIGDSWIVSFENDEIALSTLDIVRNQSFKNESIKARIKTETAFRSFLPGNSGSVQPNANNTNPRNNYQYNYPAFVPNTANYAPWMRNNQYYSEGKDGSQASHGGHREGSSGYRGGHSSEGGSRGGYEGSRRGRGGDSSSGYRGRGGRRGGAEGRGPLEGRGDSSRGEYRGSKDKSDASSNGTTNVNTNSSSAHSSSTRSRRGSAGQLQLGPSNFPPLPSKKASGYTQDYIKWSRQDFVDVINQSKEKENDFKKPEGLVDFMSLEKFTTDLDLLKPYPIREEESSSSTEQATTNSSNNTSTTESTKDQTKSENTANNTNGVDSNTTTTTTTSESESKPTTEETTKS